MSPVQLPRGSQGSASRIRTHILAKPLVQQYLECCIRSIQYATVVSVVTEFAVAARRQFIRRDRDHVGGTHRGSHTFCHRPTAELRGGNQ
jgi:hypothetical protein